MDFGSFAFVITLGAVNGALAQAPTCNQAPDPGCLYFPATSAAFTTFERNTYYTDHAGDQREVWFLIRQPLGASAPLPAVLWSHGGADGKGSPANSMVEWSEITARAGYFTVSIAHTHRETEFRGQIDIERVAVGGHSAGAGGSLTVAGARRIFVGAAVEISDPRPIAFLAFSPQQPGSEGFFDTRFQKQRHSWTDVHRPVFTATGDGDSTCNPGIEPGSCIGDTPFGRRISFQRLPADGNKYHLYLHTAEAFHTLFQLNAAKCPQLGVDPQRCAEAVRWLSSAGLAFLDAHVRQVPAAMQWLQSNRIEVASGGVAEWQRK